MSDAHAGRRRILLVGATGLIGRTLIGRTPELHDIAIQGLARREMEFPKGARVELVLADPSEWDEVVRMIAADAVICALGTTQRKAGSEEAFRAVDHDLVLTVARAAKAAGTRSFVLVSSVGADTGARNFYLRTKGEVERDLRALKFSRLDILRPGLLRGKREGDTRFLEGLGQFFAPLFNLFLHRSWKKYRSIPADDVVTAALQCTGEKADGQFVHEYDSLRRLITKFRRAQEGQA